MAEETPSKRVPKQAAQAAGTRLRSSPKAKHGHKKLCPLPRSVDVRLCPFCARTRLRSSPTDPPDRAKSHRKSSPQPDPNDSDPAIAEQLGTDQSTGRVVTDTG